MSNRYDTPPAPDLTDQARCSDCNIRVIWAADGELQICPSCYAVLWYDDPTAKERYAKTLRLAEQRERAKIRRAERDAQRHAERRADEKDHKL